MRHLVPVLGKHIQLAEYRVFLDNSVSKSRNDFRNISYILHLSLPLSFGPLGIFVHFL